jgi:hypothetical protein
MFPVSPFLLQRGLPTTPVLSIVGDGFSVWRENATALKLLLSRTVRTAVCAAHSVARETGTPGSCAAPAKVAKSVKEDDDDEACAAQNGVHAKGELDAALQIGKSG